MIINLTEKLKIAMQNRRCTQTELAARTGQTKANLNNKINRNDFKLSEYQKLVEGLGCTLEINIILPDGEKV